MTFHTPQSCNQDCDNQRLGQFMCWIIIHRWGWQNTSCAIYLIETEWTGTRMYPKVSGLATWSKNCKWYSSLPLGAVVSLLSEFCYHNPLCCFSTNVYCCKLIFHYWLSMETFGYTLICEVILRASTCLNSECCGNIKWEHWRKL